MILSWSADPGIADPHRVAVRRAAIHDQIVSEPVPEHQHDTPLAGRVPRRREQGKQDPGRSVPNTTDCGTVRVPLLSGWVPGAVWLVRRWEE